MPTGPGHSHFSPSLRKAIASATLKLADGAPASSWVKLSKSAKAALHKARKVSLVLTTTATDAAGHELSKSTKVTLV